MKNAGCQERDIKHVIKLPALTWSGILVLGLFVFGCSHPTDEEPQVAESPVYDRPAWSPDGSTIAFTIQKDSVGIYLVDTSGTNVRMIKSGEGTGLTWSPDSKWLVFSAMSFLYRMEATGDSLTMLGSGIPGINPAWSPDGSIIAYSDTGLWTYLVSSGNTYHLTTYGRYASWGSQTNSITFVVSTSGLDGVTHEFRFRALNSGQEAKFYSFVSPLDCAFCSVDSAGGTIVFSLRPFSGTGLSQVYKLKVSTSQMTQLTTDGGDCPAWSPGGKKIVYMRTAAGDGGLWIMNADGSGKHRLTS